MDLGIHNFLGCAKLCESHSHSSDGQYRRRKAKVVSCLSEYTTPAQESGFRSPNVPLVCKRSFHLHRNLANNKSEEVDSDLAGLTQLLSAGAPWIPMPASCLCRLPFVLPRIQTGCVLRSLLFYVPDDLDGDRNLQLESDISNSCEHK